MRMAQTILFVEDVPRMQAFYQGALGLAVLSEEPGWVQLDAGGVVFALHAIRPGPTSKRTEPPAERVDASTKLCFHVEDIEAARAALVAAGTRMRQVNRYGDIAFCDGIDPEGNIFQITTR